MSDLLLGQSNLGACDIAINGVVQSYCEATVEWRCVGGCHWYHKFNLSNLGGNVLVPKGRAPYVDLPMIQLIVKGNVENNSVTLINARAFVERDMDLSAKTVVIRSDEVAFEDWETIPMGPNIGSLAAAA